MKKYLFVICALLAVAAGCSGGSAAPDSIANDDSAVTDNRFGWGGFGSGSAGDATADDEGVVDEETTPATETRASRVDLQGTVRTSLIVGETLNAELSASGGSGSYIWSIESVRSSAYSFPEWVSLGEQTDNTVKITGTAVAGRFKFKAKVCDESDDGNCDKKTFTVVVGTLGLALMPSVSLSTNPCFGRLGVEIIEYTKTPTPLPGCGTDPSMPGCSTLSDTLPNIGLLGEEEMTIKFKARGNGPFEWDVMSSAESMTLGAFCPPMTPDCGIGEDSNFSTSVSSSDPGSDIHDILTLRGSFRNSFNGPTIVYTGEDGLAHAEQTVTDTLHIKVKDQCPSVDSADERRRIERDYSFNLKAPAETLIADGLPSVMLKIEGELSDNRNRGPIVELYDGNVSDGKPDGELLAKTDEMSHWGRGAFVARINITDSRYISKKIEDIKKVKILILSNYAYAKISKLTIYSRYRYVEFFSMRDLPLLLSSSSSRTLDAYWARWLSPERVCPPPRLDTNNDGHSEESLLSWDEYIEDMPDECVGE